MKKGFTLMELLAVIVILAIIATMATPIVLNIINDTKKSASERSAEFYISAIEQAIVSSKLSDITYNIKSCDVINSNEKILNCIASDNSAKNLAIEVNGKLPTSGTIILTNGKVNEVKNLLFDNYYVNRIGDKLVATTTKKNYLICASSKVLTNDTGYISSKGNEYKIGTEYICNLDKSRVFYVLETNGDNVTLIMDRNFSDNIVSQTMAWCKNSTNICNETGCPIDCSHNGLNDIITYINNLWNVQASIPTKLQVNNLISNDTLPDWLLDYLQESKHTTDVFGYWTSTLEGGSIYIVNPYGIGSTDNGYDDSTFGIRPTITLSKLQIQ